ncbi:hypothetical protein KL921_003654 [Ogataea angusta]|nr:hypothetical protein KL921_003654 [Ogataea angusta]
MLYIDQDPFLKYNPYLESAKTPFQKHWHEMLASALFYHAITMAAPLINTAIFREHYTSITNKRRKLNFDIHISAFVQSIISVALCIPMFFHPNFKSDPVFGSYDFAGLTAALTCGYFVWDLLYCCLFHFDMFGLPYLFHAAAALTVFGMTFAGFCQPTIPSFLIFEASTPFVNFYWFASRLPKGTVNETLFMVNGILLIVSFFSCRIVWGIYAAFRTFDVCLKVRDQLPTGVLPIAIGLNIGLNVLNIHWFSKMVLLAYKKFAHSGRKHE